MAKGRKIPETVRIEAGLTDINEVYCIWLIIADIRYPMHTRTAVDIVHKLSKVSLDRVMKVLVEMGYAITPPIDTSQFIEPRFGSDQDTEVVVTLDGSKIVLNIIAEVAHNLTLTEAIKIIKLLSISINDYFIEAAIYFNTTTKEGR